MTWGRATGFFDVGERFVRFERDPLLTARLEETLGTVGLVEPGGGSTGR